MACSEEAQVSGTDYVIGSLEQFAMEILRMLSATSGDWVLDMDMRSGESS